MFTLAIVCSLVGAVLGLRFRIMILWPATVIGLIAITSFDVARGAPLAALGLEAAIAITAIQVGYLCGAALRLAFAANRITANRDPASHQPQEEA
jgi:hypothetical protein